MRGDLCEERVRSVSSWILDAIEKTQGKNSRPHHRLNRDDAPLLAIFNMSDKAQSVPLDPAWRESDAEVFAATFSQVYDLRIEAHGFRWLLMDP